MPAGTTGYEFPDDLLPLGVALWLGLAELPHQRASACAMAGIPAIVS